MPPVAEFVIELACREGRLSAAQVEQAEATRAEAADEFGELPSLAATVVELGLVGEADLSELLAGELGMPFVRLTGYRAEGEALALIDREKALHYQVLPMKISEAGLEVAVADPLNLGVVDELSHVIGQSIEALVAPPSELVAAIERHYGGDPDEVVLETPSTELAESDSEAPDDEPIVRLLNAIMAEAVNQRASDIHLEPLERRFRVRYRIDGKLLEVEGPAKRFQLPLISRVKIMAGMSIAEKRLPQDGRIQLRIEGRAIDLRVSSVPTAHGESIVMRLLDEDSLKPDLGDLGLSQPDVETLRSLTRLADGMVLVTGPTGSGKTTTLYSCLQEINRPDRKIITVEDPVEYQLSGINQVPVRAEVGLSFAAALRAMLRQAPNVVMVGEIRDRETAEIAINASLTGHLVFSTLHTNDAAGAIVRLTDLGVPTFMVASSLRAVVAQRLVRRVCEKCRISCPPDAAERELLLQSGVESAGGDYCRGQGCEECHSTGYRGRVALFEFFVVNEEVERMIHENASLLELRQYARAQGMQSLREDGLHKAAAGVTTLAEVLAATVEET
ncbi:GspE/PulE family protein [Opitutaceae bacterium]|nr:GspE/PulE family protein [Opitutaceae bacterium]